MPKALLGVLAAVLWLVGSASPRLGRGGRDIGLRAWEGHERPQTSHAQANPYRRESPRSKPPEGTSAKWILNPLVGLRPASILDGMRFWPCTVRHSSGFFGLDEPRGGVRNGH